MAEKLIFMIESGKALELVKHHISERKRVSTANRDLIGDLQVDQYWTDLSDGTLRAISFKDAAHPDFTKPTKHGSWPKKATEWAKRFAGQKGYDDPSCVIAEAFSVPLSIGYRTGAGHGSRLLAVPFTECGFLYLSKDGPYAMWIPDVPGEVKADLAKGYAVEEPALSFIPVFEGCRRIEKEEWDILVAQHKLAEKRAKADA
jgi:hypothetical protein